MRTYFEDLVKIVVTIRIFFNNLFPKEIIEHIIIEYVFRFELKWSLDNLQWITTDNCVSLVMINNNVYILAYDKNSNHTSSKELFVIDINNYQQIKKEETCIRFPPYFLGNNDNELYMLRNSHNNTYFKKHKTDETICLQHPYIDIKKFNHNFLLIHGKYVFMINKNRLIKTDFDMNRNNDKIQNQMRKIIQVDHNEQFLFLFFNYFLIVVTNKQVIFYDDDKLKQIHSISNLPQNIITICVNANYMFILHNESKNLVLDIFDLNQFTKYKEYKDGLSESIIIKSINTCTQKHKYLMSATETHLVMTDENDKLNMFKL